jgi:hypothetical protein
LRLATQTQPRSPIPTRNAARTASQAKAQRGRLCCQRATPCVGTRSPDPTQMTTFTMAYPF